MLRFLASGTNVPCEQLQVVNCGEKLLNAGVLRTMLIPWAVIQAYRLLWCSQRTFILLSLSTVCKRVQLLTWCTFVRIQMFGALKAYKLNSISSIHPSFGTLHFPLKCCHNTHYLSKTEITHSLAPYDLCHPRWWYLYSIGEWIDNLTSLQRRPNVYCWNYSQHQPK